MATIKCGVGSIPDYETMSQNDVEYFENPAYLVKEPSIQGEGRKEGVGCIVKWNKAFEEMTNFLPLHIDNSYCHLLLEGYQETKDKKTKDRIYIPLCSPICEFRTGTQGNFDRKATNVMVRNVWINSKDRRQNDIKQLVDILIFPFEDKVNEEKTLLFALHVLFDKRRVIV